MSYKEDQLAAEEAKHRADQAESFYSWLVKHQEYNYTAAINLIKAYYNGDDWSPADLTESAAILTEKGVISPLSADRVESDAATAKREAEDAETNLRAELVEYIMANRRMSDETREAENIRLRSKHTTTQTLQTIADNVKRARLSESELAALAKEEESKLPAKRGIRQSRFLPVPEIYTHGVGGRSMLISLANTDLDEYKRIMARCNPVEIQAILDKKGRE